MTGGLGAGIDLALLGQQLWWLLVAALLGAALGVIRPVRREIVPRSAHVIHAQILLAIVGAMILRGSSTDERRYEVKVPYQEKIRKLTELIRGLDGHEHHGKTAAPSVEWEIKKVKTVRP